MSRSALWVAILLGMLGVKLLGPSQGPHALEWMDLERMLWASALTLVAHWLTNRRWGEGSHSLDECD
jgi:hypothetical protein